MSDPQDEVVVQLDIMLIDPNPFQPRERFDEDALNDLAETIRKNGLQQPVIVRQSPLDPARYQLVMGERRTRACKLIGKTTISSIIRQNTDADMEELALIENLQRDDLKPAEEARSLKRLLDRYEGSLQRVAEQLSKGQAYISDRLLLLELPTAVQALVDEGKINTAQYKVIAELEGEAIQIEAAKRAVKLNLTANELRGRMQGHLRGAGGSTSNGSGSKITLPQLSSTLVRVYDGLEGYDLSSLGDTAKRGMLKKQLILVRSKVDVVLENIEAAESSGKGEMDPREADEREAFEHT